MNFDENLSHRKIWPAVVLVVTFAFVAAFALNLKHGYDESLAGATATSQNLALVLEQHAAATIQKADLVVDHIVDEFSPQAGKDLSDAEKANAYLAELLHALPEMKSLRIIKANGYTLADASGTISSNFFGDRRFFIRHRDNPNLGLEISGPLQDPILPGWSIVLSHRMSNPDGSFAGIVAATIGLEFFEKFYGSLNLGQNTSLTLLNEQRVILARFPVDNSLRGKSHPCTQLEARLLQGSSAGTYTTESELDHVERIVSYQKIGNQPLFAIVGIAKKDSLAEWRRNALIDSAALIFLIVTVAFLSLGMLRRYRHERETSKQLHAASFYARNLIEASLDPIVTISPDGKITDVNRSAEHITGAPREQLTGSDFCDYFTEPAKAREVYRKAFADGFVRDYPLAIRHPAGHITDVLYNVTVYRDETGEVQGVFAAAHDVTESRRSEHMLEFENHALSITSGSPPLSATLEILCLGMEKILEGELCSILLLDDDGRHLRHGAAPSLPEAYNRALDGVTIGPAVGSCGTAAHTGRQVIVADIANDPLWADYKELALSHGLAACWATPIYSATGDVLGTFAVYTRKPYQPTSFDLQATGRAAHLASIAIQRKRTDEALQNLNETLEHRVADEVAKNMEQERMLIQQSRLAAMGEMIGNIAHQWRQPLNALGLLLSNIKDAHDFNELDATTIAQSTAKGRQLINKMSTTIDDFRNFFKPNKEKTAFSLNQSIQSTLDILSASLRNHNVATQIEAGEDVVAFGFPNEYSQVLLNIINNAKDALASNKVGNGLIHIRIARSGDQASISIRDNAGGIPADILLKIFDPYFTTKEKGTGIGLYMSKMIIEDSMNGRIEARNVEGGAEFTVTCPLAE